MKINNIGYLLKEGIRGIFLHGFMSFAAVCVTVACLLIVGSFSCLTHNVSLLVKDLNKTNEIVAYVDEDLSKTDAKSLETKIRKLSSVIVNAEFVSNEEALQEFLKEHEGDDAFEGVDASYLRHRVVVTLESGKYMRQITEQIRNIQGIADIEASFELADNFTMLENVLQIVSVALIAVLLVVSLLIISNTVKLAMHERRDEIAIMKMVGATNGFIRLPYVVEGFTLGMVGAAAAFGLLWLLYDMLLARLEEAGMLAFFRFVPFETMLVPMICIFAAAGLFVGVVGSWTSIRKFMNV